MRTRDRSKARWRNRKIKTETYFKLTTPLMLIIVLNSTILGIKYFKTNMAYASYEASTASINLDDLDEISKKNAEEYGKKAKENIKTEIEKKEIELEYITEYETDETLPKGMVQVVQEGRAGTQEIVLKRTYKDEELINEEQISNKMTKVPINKIVITGTSKYRSNYKVRIGDTLYAVPEMLAIRYEMNEEADKVTTINRNESVTLLEIENDWYKISHDDYIGYAQAESLTYINPNVATGDTEEGQTKESLLSKLDFNMNVNVTSGLTIEQYRRILSNNEQDKNKIFETNADYFYYTEKQYKVNGVFLAALAIHESAWGTSSIAVNKRNLFGYGAKDANPYANAYTYSDYAQSIDLVARALVKYYLNPAGTKIYDGEIASGTYYYGTTISAVNTKYATDKNWANAIYSYIKLLYNNL